MDELERQYAKVEKRKDRYSGLAVARLPCPHPLDQVALSEVVGLDQAGPILCPIREPAREAAGRSEELILAGDSVTGSRRQRHLRPERQRSTWLLIVRFD